MIFSLPGYQSVVDKVLSLSKSFFSINDYSHFLVLKVAPRPAPK